MSRAQLFPHAGFDFPETDTTHKSLCPLCNTAATVVLGMGQKAGLLNIYLFVVQSADYPDWGNVMLGSKWKLCQIGKPGCRTRNSIYFAFSSKKNMWHVYPVMGCRCTNMHMKNMKNGITLHLATACFQVQFQPAVVDVE